MPIFTIQTPDGRKLKIEAADQATAIRGAQEWSATQSGYAKAKAHADRYLPKQSFTDQLIYNLGVQDELTGGVLGAAQAGKNLLRRATGREIEVTAGDAYRAGSDLIKERGKQYAKEKPARNVLSFIGGMAVAGKPSGPPPAMTAMQAGRNAAVLNAPFALARQEGDLKSRLPGAALETALTFGAGSLIQGAANQLSNQVAKRAANAAFSPPTAAVAKKAAARNVLAQRVQAFDDAGVEPTLAAVKGGAASNIANAVAENPLGVRQRAQLGRSVEQAGEAANDLVEKYGANRGAQIIGENVQEGVGRFASDKFSGRAGELYDRAFQPILQGEQAALRANPTAAPVVAKKTAQTLGEIAGSVNSKALSEIITDPRVSRIASAMADDPASVRFGDLRALRTWVREAKSNPQLRQGISQASLSRIETALTADIYASAEALGGAQAVKSLKDADRYYRVGSERIAKALQPFADAKAGESAYNRIVQAASSGGSADAQKLLSLKRSLPQSDWGDVSATALAEMGKPSAGAAKGADDGAFSISQFVTNYARLSDRGKAILFGDVGGGGAKAAALRKELDNLVKVAGMLKSVEKGANASRSGVALQQIGTTTAAVGSLFTGTWPALLAAVGGTGALAEAMTNPAFVRWLARAPKPGAAPAVKAAHLAQLQALGQNNQAVARIAEQIGARLRDNARQSGPPEARQAATTR